MSSPVEERVGRRKQEGYNFGFEFPKNTTMKSTIFWPLAPCILIEIYWTNLFMATPGPSSLLG
jgi:hypothetical protein